MMHRFLQIIIFLAACLVLKQGLAQRHYFVPYSVNEGLAQSQVRDIIQTKDGFIWIATVGGISRFDGITFKTYNKSNGLINNLTNALHEGNDGSMIASCAGGIVKFSNGNIESFKFDGSYSNTLINDFLALDSHLILGSNGRGLLVFKKGNIERQIDLGSKDKNFIRCLSKGENGIIAGTKEGLLSIDEHENVRVLNDSISVTSIAGNSNDQWIATNGDGIFRLKNGALTQITKEDGLANMYIRDICIDKDGNPWLISKNTIQKINSQTLRFEIIKSFDPIMTSNMKVIYPDQENNIWVGTDGYGILKFTGSQFSIYNSEDGLTSNLVMDIDQTADGDMLLATYGYGLVILNQNNIDSIGYDQGLTNLTIWSLLVLDDKVFLGTSDGIQILKNGSVSAFEFNHELPFPRISNLYEDSDGNIWIATRNGVSIFDGEGIFTPPSIQDLHLNDCKGITELDGDIWITSNKGLAVYRSDGSAQLFSKNNGFPEDYLTCLKSGNQSDLWIGTEEGLIHYNPKNNTPTVIRISAKVSSNIINFIENENNSRLWIGTDNGLFHLDQSLFYRDTTIAIRGFNQHDGIISNECNQNASFTDNKGRVWFGTNGGLIKFEPDHSVMISNQVLGIYINDVQANFESIYSDSSSAFTSDKIAEFNYDESRISFRYSAIHFANPDKISFSHRLIGIDDEWSPTTKENYITFSNLAPGTYQFEVRAKIDNGNWATTTAHFEFEIISPFWMRWWFILGCILILSGFSFQILRQYQTQVRRKRQLIEFKNRAKVLGLEQQTLNAHMNRHFIFNALNSIQYFINTQDRKQANQYLTNFASLVRKNLDSAQVEYISLKDEIERLELYINLEQMRFKDRFSFDFIIDSTIDLDYIQVPSMILQPFVENSIMHGILPSADFGKIVISIALIEDDLKFVIDDNGIGIETSVQNKNGTSQHVSNGMKITKQRIEIIARALKNDRLGVFGPFELKDSGGGVLGTRVEIILPVNYQKFKQFHFN